MTLFAKTHYTINLHSMTRIHNIYQPRTQQDTICASFNLNCSIEVNIICFIEYYTNMPSKYDLLAHLSVKQLKELANENNVPLIIEGFFSDSKATSKDEILEVLSESRKISIKKINGNLSDSFRKQW